MPIGLNLIFDICILAFCALFIGMVDHKALASYQIASQLQFIALFFPIGFGQSGTILASQFLGANNQHLLPQLKNTILKLSLGFMFCFSLIYVLFAKDFALLFMGKQHYTNQPFIANTTIKFIYILAVFNLFDAIRVSGTAYLRGVRDIKIPLLIGVFWFWVVFLILIAFIMLTHVASALTIWLIVAFCFIGAGMSIYFRMQTTTKRLLI